MNILKGRVFPVIFSVLLMMIVFMVPAGADTVIIHTNDVHGYFTDNIGYDGLSAYIQERTAAGDEIILLDAGDASQGRLETDVFGGKSAIDIMNMLKYDAMAVGNHEYYYGISPMLELRDMADFPLLAANVFYKNTGKNVFTESLIIPLSEYKIGVFGLSTPETLSKIKRVYADNIVIADGDELYTIAQQQVDSLKKQGCNFIICLGHLGVGTEYAPDQSIDVAEHVGGIDLFIDGHSHTELPGGLKVGDTLIVSTGCHLKNIGVVTLNQDNITAELISGYEKKDEKITDVCNSYFDAGVKKMVSTVVGESKVNFDTTRDPGVRTQEMPIGDLITDALMYAVQQRGYDPDCAIINGGSISEGISAGKITEADVYYLFKFNNTVSVIEIPGSLLLQILEINTEETPEPKNGFPQVSGIDYTINIDKPYVKGEINRVTINSVNGKPFDSDAVYTVATIDFVSGGNKKYKDLLGCKSENLGISDDSAFISYLSECLNGVIDERYAEPAGRIHIIGTGLDNQSSENIPAIPAKTPLPFLAVLAGIVAGIVLADKRR